MSRLFLGACLGVLAAEAFHPAGGIQQLLLAGKEGMAIRADFHVDVALVGGAGGKGVPAGAVDTHFVVSGMNSGFHDFKIPFSETFILAALCRCRNLAGRFTAEANGNESVQRQLTAEIPREMRASIFPIAECLPLTRSYLGPPQSRTMHQPATKTGSEPSAIPIF